MFDDQLYERSETFALNITAFDTTVRIRNNAIITILDDEGIIIQCTSYSIGASIYYYACSCGGV